MKIITALAFILCLAIGVPSIYGTTQSDHGSERVLRHDSDPVQDDVTSPPVPKYTGKPSYSPTVVPTVFPSESPSLLPTGYPTVIPSTSPSSFPTGKPSKVPSIVLSNDLSSSPTTIPSHILSNAPTGKPTIAPTPIPSNRPTFSPTPFPSASPSRTSTVPPSLPPSGQPSIFPSKSPTHATSLSPSVDPTHAPSLILSTLPTNESTIAPSIVPSHNPTVAPSVTLSTLPSSSSVNPSPIPSTSPSIIPTVVHSMAPTASESPSIALSYIPSTSISPTEVKECSPNNDGLFGSEGDFELAIEFAYELETHTSIPSDVLPPLENVFSAAILPSLFPERCSNRLAPSTRRRRLAAIGVSARPEDVVLDSVACGKKKSNNNNCAVVQGELTLFLSEDKSNEMMNQAIIQILKDGMTNDEFVHAHPDIERVTFVMLSAIPKSSATVSEDSPTPAPSNRDGLGVLWGVIATVVGLLFLLAAFVWRRKQKEAEDEEDSEANEGSLDPEAGNPNIGGDLLG